mgnify:CR=1 FL=1
MGWLCDGHFNEGAHSLSWSGCVDTSGQTSQSKELTLFAQTTLNVRRKWNGMEWNRHVYCPLSSGSCERSLVPQCQVGCGVVPFACCVLVPQCHVGCGAVPWPRPSCYCCAERSPPDPFPGLASPVCYREASAAEFPPGVSPTSTPLRSRLNRAFSMAPGNGDPHVIDEPAATAGTPEEDSIHAASDLTMATVSAEGLPVSAESTENLVMPDDAPAMTSSDDLHQLEQVIYPLIRHTSDPRPRSLTSSRPRSLTSSPPPPRRQNGLRMSYGLRQTAAFGSGGPADSDEDYQKTGGIVSTWRASCRSACGPGEFQTEDTLQPTVG